MIIVLLCLGAVVVAEPPGYQTYEEQSAELVRLAREHPSRAHLHSIGRSVQGRELWVLSMASRRPEAPELLRPEVKFVGNVHGNELVIGEVLMRFITDLLTNPSKDARIDEILNTTRVHVLVRLNPDPGRLVLADNCTDRTYGNNSNNYDLNMNYPDRWFCQRDPMQPETLAMIEWLESQRFLLSARFFTGGMVSTYPYEYWPGADHATKPQESLTEDDDVFKFLAKKYSLNHKFMALPSTICDGNQWKDGIVNGGTTNKTLVCFKSSFNF